MYKSYNFYANSSTFRRKYEKMGVEFSSFPIGNARDEILIWPRSLSWMFEIQNVNLIKALLENWTCIPFNRYYRVPEPLLFWATRYGVESCSTLNGLWKFMVSVSVSSHDDVQHRCKVALSLPFLYDVNVFACDIYLDLCWSHAPEYPPKCSVSIIRTIDVSECEPKYTNRNSI